MRISATENQKKSYKIIAVDDEIGIIDSLSVFLKKSGYSLTGITNPNEAIERVKNEHFDIMLLDYIMSPIHGDQVVEEIRKFNSDLYIILLTGHKDLVPPLETIKKLAIQGYCEKSDKFDQLLLLIESGIKSVDQMHTIREVNEKLKKSNEQIERAYLESIQTLRYTVEAKDRYTRGHSDRVSDYAMLLGEKLGLSSREVKTLKIGGLFHDIGKIGIPDHILLKEGSLSPEEFNEIKKHPEIGKRILKNATIFNDIIPIVYYHHERFDGGGYPEGLKGEDIPYLARITTVVDTFDAMTSSRSYRKAIPIEKVIEEIQKNSGTQFDPQITNVFLDILKNNYDKIQEIINKYK